MRIPINQVVPKKDSYIINDFSQRYRYMNYLFDDIREAVDIAIGDDGYKGLEVLNILKILLDNKENK